MPRCICKNCDHSEMCEGSRLCRKHMVFVEDEDTCLDWENDALFDPTKLVLFTIATVAIVIFLSKIL